MRVERPGDMSPRATEANKRRALSHSQRGTAKIDVTGSADCVELDG